MGSGAKRTLIRRKEAGGKEENKNYVKKFVGNYCSFGPKEDAKAFTSEEAEQMRRLLENSVGNAFVIDDDRVLSQGG